MSFEKWKNSKNAYLILQLKSNEDTEDMRFESIFSLKSCGKQPAFEYYDVVYAGSLLSHPETRFLDKGKNEILEYLFEKFNIDIPDDFRGHSLSVSDVVILKLDGKLSVHYVDAVGFADLTEKWIR